MSAVNSCIFHNIGLPAKSYNCGPDERERYACSTFV